MRSEMRLARAILPTPIGHMVALSSGEGLCALEFMGPAPRLTSLDARLRRWFPPHEIADQDTALIAQTASRVEAVLAEGLEHHLFLGRVLGKVRS